MSPAEIVPTTLPDASKVLTAAEEPPVERCRFAGLRGVKWRINLGILPPSSSSSSSSVGDLRRVTADCRRRYAGLRRRLLIDPHIPKDGSNSPDPVMDNPLSQNPDSTWGRFFRSAELEKMVDQDLSRLYPEHGSYFQTSGCQGVLRRILLLWCLRHPEYGYRQGMHELLAPLLYVLHVDIDRLSQVRKLHEDHFIDKFDGLLYHENDLTYNFDFKRFSDSVEDEIGFPKTSMKSLDELDPEIQTIVLLSDAYGAEGELGVVLSEKFMEHDAYCMFDALMSGAHGSVAMADFFSPSPIGGHTAIPPVIEASTALYHLLSIVDSSLHSHLVELGVEPQYFALRWFRVLFGREFVLEDLLIIWDEIFAADNRRLDKGSEGDVAFKILTSHRGAYITAIAVSMILHQRSSLLATENATSCLKRLLNFPENVDLKKLFDKAKSLKALALDSNMNISSPISLAIGPFSRSKSMALTTLPGSASPKTLQSSVNDSYWEEKWRVMLKAEELKEGGSTKPIPTRKKGWTEKVSFGLSRTTSAPSPAQAGSGRKNKRSSVRRSLLEDLSKALGADEDIEKVVGNHEVEGQDDGEAVVSEERCSSRYTGSEENSSVFSGSMSPHALEEHDSEKSSVASNPCIDENEVHPQSATEDLPLPLEASQNSEHNIDSPGKQATGVKERKLLLGKFQWIWKFGRHAAAGEGTSEKGEDAPPGPINSSIVDDDDDHSITTETSTANGTCTSLANEKGDATDHNVMGPFRNLGQSMLEHIQVIEAVFQQERGQAENSSKNALVGKGQVTAVAALKELRKISNILSEM